MAHHTTVAMASQPMQQRSVPLTQIDPASAVPHKTHRRVRGYLDGCFDVMHSGHYNLFRQARMLCDELIVGVHSASEIEKTKGCAPVQTDVERIRLVGCVKSAIHTQALARAHATGLLTLNAQRSARLLTIVGITLNLCAAALQMGGRGCSVHFIFSQLHGAA